MLSSWENPQISNVCSKMFLISTPLEYFFCCRCMSASTFTSMWGKSDDLLAKLDKLPEQRNALSDTKLSRHSDCMQWKCFTWFLFLMHFELTFDFRGFFKRQSDPVHVLYSTVAIRGGGNGTVTEVLTKQIKVLTTCTLLNSFVSFLGRYSVI